MIVLNDISTAPMAGLSTMASTATSVPAPIATPTSAIFSSRCFVGEPADLWRRLDTETLEQVRAAIRQCATLDRRLDAMAGNGLKVRRSRNRQLALGCARDDRVCHRMLGVLLDRRGKPKCAIFGEPIDGAHGDDPVLAEGQRARLVEHNRGEKACLLEPTTVAHERDVTVTRITRRMSSRSMTARQSMQ